MSVGLRISGERHSYLGSHVLVTGGADEGEADEEDVRLGVGQRAETVVILLTGGIPDVELDLTKVLFQSLAACPRSATGHYRHEKAMANSR